MYEGWRGRRYAALVLAAAVFAAISTCAQDVPPAFTLSRDVAEAHLWFAAQDRAGQPVDGITTSQLTVFDGARRVQRLSLLTQVADAPVRVHFVVDVSGSEQLSLGMVRNALAQFVAEHSRPGDAIFVTAFSGHSWSAQVRSPKDLESFWTAAAKLIGKPVTAIYDNLYPVLEANPDYDNVVLISDGDDNWSVHHGLPDILSAVQQSPSRLFVLGVYGKRYSPGQEVLEQIAQAGGGQVLGVRTVPDAKRTLTGIGRGLRTYYTVAFPITEEQRDGRFHPVTLRISDGRIARIQRKPGYFAPRRKAGGVETASAGTSP